MIGAYHRLWRIEKSFRMSKHGLKARSIYHHERESIDAHLTIVFAALAITRLIEDRTGWSISEFVRATRRYRTIQIHAGQHVLTAEDPSQPTYAPRSPRSPNEAVRTNLAQVRELANDYSLSGAGAAQGQAAKGRTSAFLLSTAARACGVVTGPRR